MFQRNRPRYRPVSNNGSGSGAPGSGPGGLSGLPRGAPVSAAPAGLSGVFGAVLTLAVATIAVVGVAVSTGLWVYNDDLIKDKNDRQQGQIEALIADVASINASLPDGNGTVFFDDEWVMAHGPEPGRKFMFNASQISPGMKTNYIWPNVSGTVVLQETSPTMFPENLFAVTGEFDSRQIEFDLDLLTAGASRVFRWPNKNGVVATIADVVAVAGNTSEFLDSEFAILNDPDTTKLARFNASLLDTNTNRTYFFPNLDGTLVLTTGNQTLSDKILDNSNTIAVLDTEFTLENAAGGPGDEIQFDLSAVTAPRTISFANTDLTVVGRVSGSWSSTSLGLSSAGTYSDIQLGGAQNTDRFFRFRSGGGAPNGLAGVCLSSFDSNNWFLAADANDGGALKLFWNNSLPSADGELGDAILSVDQGTKDLQLHQSGDDTVYEALDVSQLTAPRTGTFPDTDCTFLCESATQNVTNKNLDTSNTITVLDTGFAIDNGTGAQLTFDTSSLTTSQSLSAPDNSGEIALNYNEEAAYVRLDSNFAVADNSNTKIVWSNTPVLNANGNWDTGTDEYTCPTDGLYRVSCYVTWSGGTPASSRLLFLVTSGSIGTLTIADQRGVTSRLSQGASITIPLNATDTIFVEAFQDSGSPNNVLANDSGGSGTYMMIEYVGPHSQV